jgi:5-methylcytosine-specific restriction endonuclease McrA
MHPRNLAPAQTLPWRSWYNHQSWRRRAKHQLRTEPLCWACLAKDRVTPATVADYVVDHEGDYTSFRLGALQSLCHDCHERKHASGNASPYPSKAKTAWFARPIIQSPHATCYTRSHG